METENRSHEHRSHENRPQTGETGQRSPEEIEREIAETRSEIEETVGELGERLQPRALMDDARSYVRESATRTASETWDSLSSTIRENAVPFALIGGGVVWLLASRRSNGRSRFGRGGYDYGYGYDPYRYGYGRSEVYGGPGGSPGGSTGGSGWEREHDGGTLGSGTLGSGTLGSAGMYEARERTGELASRTAERAREATGHLRERGRELESRAEEQMHRVRSGLERMQSEQPLLLGVASLALGALVGGALPSTRREDELLGETRDRVVEAAAETGRETAEQVRQAAGEAAERARESASQPASEPATTTGRGRRSSTPGATSGL